MHWPSLSHQYCLVYLSEGNKLTQHGCSLKLLWDHNLLAEREGLVLNSTNKERTPYRICDWNNAAVAHSAVYFSYKLYLKASPVISGSLSPTAFFTTAATGVVIFTYIGCPARHFCLHQNDIIKSLNAHNIQNFSKLLEHTSHLHGSIIWIKWQIEQHLFFFFR